MTVRKESISCSRSTVSTEPLYPSKASFAPYYLACRRANCFTFCDSLASSAGQRTLLMRHLSFSNLVDGVGLCALVAKVFFVGLILAGDALVLGCYVDLYRGLDLDSLLA